MRAITRILIGVLVAWSLQSGTVAAVAPPSVMPVATASLPAVGSVLTTADPTIAAAGDIGCGTADSNYYGGLGTPTACRMKYTSDLMVNGGYTGVLALGDTMQSDPTLNGFTTVFDPTWGRVKPIIHPVPGNHEYGLPGASGYFSYFGAAAGDPAKGYYSFDLGAWHVVALNSNCAQISGGCAAGGAQESWLRADLAAHPGQCTLAFDHHPRYSSGHEGDSTFLTDLYQDLYSAGADVLLSGHSHDYERFDPQDNAARLDLTGGITQFVAGTGGAFFTGLGTPHPNSVVSQNSTFGVLALTLHQGSYDWRFVPEAGATWTDSGTRSCHHGASLRLVQSGGATETVAASTLTAALPASSTAGDLLVLEAAGYTGATNGIASVTDTAGNTWTKAGAYFVSGHYSEGELWFCASARPVTSVTARSSTAVVRASTVLEFAGIAATSPLDRAVGTAGTSTVAGSGPITPTVVGELLVGFVAGHGSTQAMTVTTSGFTSLPQRTSAASTPTSVRAGYRVGAAATPVSMTATFGAPMYWAAGIAAFRVAG